MKDSKTSAYSWGLLLLAGWLTGCHDQKKDINDITQEEAKALVEQHFTTSCVSVTADTVGSVKFNTLNRVPGKTPDDKWVTLPDQDIISLSAQAAEIRKQQIDWLTQHGMLIKISNAVYLGRGTLRGYYHQAINYKKGEKKGEWTYEDKGEQYRLTPFGRQHLSQPDLPTLAFCIGQWAISTVVLYKALPSAPDKVKVTFKTSLVNPPAWLSQKSTRDVFPYVVQQWQYKNIPTTYTAYIKILNGQYVIENDQFYHTPDTP